MTDDSKKKASSRTSYEKIANILRQEIVSGQLPAGTRLTMEDVAERLSVSTMPVRQAFQRLQGEGIIEALPHKGAKVVPLGKELVSNIYDLRGAIESLLIQNSIPNITNAAMEKLDQLHAELKEAVEQGASSRVFDINARFHRLIYLHAGNPMAMEIYDRYAGLLGALRKRYGVNTGRLQGRVDRVSKTIAALHAKDRESLGQLARLHCELSKQELLALMDTDQESED